MENQDNLILGISFNGEPCLYLAKENWNTKSFKKLLTAAGMSIVLSGTKSKNDAIQKILDLLIREAKGNGAVDIPSTYGWHGSGNQFYRVRKTSKTLIWKELKEKCIR